MIQLPTFRPEEVIAFSFDLPADWNFSVIKEFVIKLGERTPFGFVNHQVAGPGITSVSVITLERLYQQFVQAIGEVIVEMEHFRQLQELERLHGLERPR